MFRHTRLVIKAIRFPWNGRSECHGQPVFELWVLAPDFDPQGVIVECAHPIETVLPKIEPARFTIGLALLLNLPQLSTVFAQAHNMFGHQAKYGRNHARAGQPPNAVDVVMGGEFTSS